MKQSRVGIYQGISTKAGERKSNVTTRKIVFHSQSCRWGDKSSSRFRLQRNAILLKRDEFTHHQPRIVIMKKRVLQPTGRKERYNLTFITGRKRMEF